MASQPSELVTEAPGSPNLGHKALGVGTVMGVGELF